MTAPDTQLEAWNSIQDSLGSRQRQVLNVIALSSRAGHEVADLLGWPTYQTLPRITELKEKNLIHDTGRRKFNPFTGKRTIIWGVNPLRTNHPAPAE